MFNNIALKLQKLAIIEFICSVLLGVVLSIFLGFTQDETVLGVTLLITVPVAGYINGLMFYAFGELIDKLSDTEERVGNLEENVYLIATHVTGGSNEDSKG